MNSSRTKLQQTLPSFREIVPPEIHHAIDSAQYSSSSNTSPMGTLSATMPSVAEGFDGLNARYSEQDSGERAYFPRRASNTTLGTNTVTSHAGLPHSFDSQSGFEGRNQQYGSYQQGSSPLPPIRDLSTLQGRPEEQTPHHPHSNGYPQTSASFQGLDSASYSSRRRGPCDSAQRGTSLYPPIQGVAGFENAEYLRNTPLHHEYTHRSTPYGAYSPTEYPSHVLGNPSYPSYGSIGDTTRKRRGNLPKHVTDILKAWFQDHLDHPYPTEEDKRCLHNRTMLSIQQISNWFINARRRQLPHLREVRAAQNRSQEHEQDYGPSSADMFRNNSHESSLSPT